MEWYVPKRRQGGEMARLIAHRCRINGPRVAKGTDLSVHAQTAHYDNADILYNGPRATNAFHFPLEAFAAMPKATHQPSTSVH
jgi:hypothetical protein